MEGIALSQQMIATLAKAKEYKRDYRSLNRQLNLRDPQQTTRILETLKAIQQAWQQQMARYEELKQRYQNWVRVGRYRMEM